jgi:hypothetical protein
MAGLYIVIVYFFFVHSYVPSCIVSFAVIPKHMFNYGFIS